jgi:predicted transcriptional regulator
MRTDAPALLPILRSQVQAGLLALMTYLNPEQESTVTEAALRVGASLRAVHHEIGRLVQADLLTDRRHGNNRSSARRRTRR